MTGPLAMGESMFCRSDAEQQQQQQQQKSPFPGSQGTGEIQGNEHADRLIKAGLKRVAKHSLTSLSYIKRKAKEEILAQ
jgi:hypothetical protein